MTLQLHTIGPNKGAKKKRTRVGRGLSKGGSYSGRGVKGQRARSGGRAGLKLMGLRRIMLQLPKQRGFTSLNEPYEVVNVGDLARFFADGATITPKILLTKGLIRQQGKVKILGRGDINIKLSFEDCRLSATAKEKITKAGGKIIS